MSNHANILKQIQTEKNWSLFLDRDGVVNRRIPGAYVRNWAEFEFLEGVLEAVAGFSLQFEQIIVVTNQRGIAKGYMTQEDVEKVHHQMLEAVKDAGGTIDAVYYCPDLGVPESACRKPNIGMALQAQKDNEKIDFQKSVMVGDSFSDMEFGKRLGMTLIFVETKGDLTEEQETLLQSWNVHRVPSLIAWWNEWHP